MIGHDDEAKEEERVELLDAIQTVNGFPCIGSMCKDRSSIQRHRRHEHRLIILDEVALGHSQ